MTSDQYENILQPLKEQFRAARVALDAASEKFDAVIRDVPSGLPHPDGTYRIKRAAGELSRARTNLKISAQRLNGFIAHGVVPDDLKKYVPKV